MVLEWDMNGHLIGNNGYDQFICCFWYVGAMWDSPNAIDLPFLEGVTHPQKIVILRMVYWVSDINRIILPSDKLT